MRILTIGKRIGTPNGGGTTLPPFEVNSIAYGDGTLTGGSDNWVGAWNTSGILPKLWSNGTDTGGGGIGAWSWAGDWVLA